MKNTESLQKYHLHDHFIIKMLRLNKNSKLDFNTAHATLTYVPVSIQLVGGCSGLIIKTSEKVYVVFPEILQCKISLCNLNHIHDLNYEIIIVIYKIIIVTKD